MYEVILFDLDGTLTDSREGILKSVKYALAKMNIEAPEENKLLPFIGPPLITSFREYFKMNDAEVGKAIEYYREWFGEQGIYENQVYPGILLLLKKLKAQGKRLVLATSKPTEYAIRILDYFRLNIYFDVVVGSNMDGTRMEKEAVIEFALAKVGEVEKHKVVMIGDRKYDVIGSKKNGIDVIGVAYGYGSLDELSGALPTQLVSSVQELAKVLEVGDLDLIATTNEG